MIVFIRIVPCIVAAVLALSIPAQAQNPCDEIGSDCRLMTAVEVNAFKERLLAVKALLPVPDTARYKFNGAAEASTMPFIAETKIPGAVITCRSWPAGGFPDYPKNSLLFGYDGQAGPNKNKPAKKSGSPEDILTSVQGMMSAMENRVEVTVWLLPHPYLVDNVNGKIMDIRDEDPTNVEKSATFLSWESGEGTNVHMIFGPRTAQESETVNTEKPANNFAPVKCIELLISGPKDEVATLKKKINRKAFEALLGPVVK